MKHQIKLCPFCGNEAALMNTVEEGATDIPPNCHVYCMGCLASGPEMDLKEVSTRKETARVEQAAIAAWNRRATHEQ